MDLELFAELQRRAIEVNCLVAYEPELPTHVNVYYQEKLLGFILDNRLIAMPDSAGKPVHYDICSKVQELISEITEYITAYQKGAYFADFALPDGYHHFINYNEMFLAAKKLENGGYQFVTWQLDSAGTGFDYGQYTNDYKTAKRDFTQRSGLIQQNELFSLSELFAIQIAAQHALEYCGELSFDSARTLKGILVKVADNLSEMETSACKAMESEQTL